ncbi:hypothetical protein M422DRAFT_243772 [Sphaerobolus stellatus SS14]|nr:hypothetical protein M422DRAFT_243772 [Sphaerobolus stellatus SS14]
MPADRSLKRKPHVVKAPYKCHALLKPQVKDAPKMTAKPIKQRSRENLTLHDWLTVFAFVDNHPGMSQDEILKNREELEARADETPNALSSKRRCIVTRPDVKKALYLWVKQMEVKGETVSGPMLLTKCGRFENAFDVPEEERLTGDGWLTPFCRAYKIKEQRRHGEAGSVDLAAVEAEQIRVRGILSKYPPKDTFNFDKTSFFAFAPSDRGLATQQMSGKKADKFRITVGVACSMEGEKLPLLFIGKSKQPRCFKGKAPCSWGFQYFNNQKAWMTMDIFEKWIKDLDIKMWSQNRHICLLLNNFSGHYISYEPKNINLEFFEPNMTPFVQPCDAGITRCFKAHYRRTFCNQALDQEEAGEKDIYKINLLEAIMEDTIEHCWEHTKIIPGKTQGQTTHDNTPVLSQVQPKSPQKDIQAWKIILEFATSDMGSPQAEAKLEAYLGTWYRDADWRAAFKAVMDAENDQSEALKSLDKLTMKIFNLPILQLQTSTQPPAMQTDGPLLPERPAELNKVEEELQKCVNELAKHKRIIGKPLTLEEMLNPIEERQDADSYNQFIGTDETIIAQVKYEMAVQRGEIIEVDKEDSEDEEVTEVGPSHEQIAEMCRLLEGLCLQYGPPDASWTSLIRSVVSVFI